MMSQLSPLRKLDRVVHTYPISKQQLCIRYLLQERATKAVGGKFCNRCGKTTPHEDVAELNEFVGIFEEGHRCTACHFWLPERSSYSILWMDDTDDARNAIAAEAQS